MSTPVTVILQSKNEEEFIGRCVSSIEWADQILLLDSGSTDRTVDIAESLGADTVVTDWPGWAKQRKRAEAIAKHDWVFAMDCDEIVTPALRTSILQVLSGPLDPRDGYSVTRRGDFLGILLPDGSRRKTKINTVRLYNRQHSGYDESVLVHEFVRVAGTRHLLDGDLIHWRGYSMDEYFHIFNSYATKEAELLFANGTRARLSHLIARPIARFCWHYFMKGGWRLGTRGVMHAGVKACSEFMRYSKLWEMQYVPHAVLHPEPDILVCGTSKTSLSATPSSKRDNS